MKSLTNYVHDEQTALFDELGVIFAFSEKQFDEKKKLMLFIVLLVRA
ncbi:DUF7659 family protein [Actinoplanes utahensis]